MDWWVDVLTGAPLLLGFELSNSISGTGARRKE